jgi:hypothetical protein
MTINCTNEQTNGRQESLSHKAAGPRTELGKERSSRNAIRHGIFSEVILLKGESRLELESLRLEFWKKSQPEGAIEEFLVDKLVSIAWRYRRFLLAETGEIRNQFLQLDGERIRRRNEVTDRLAAEDHLAIEIQDPDVLKRCLQLLAELREGIQTAGFKQERDIAILQQLYGTAAYESGSLGDQYSRWFQTAQASEEKRERKGYATPEECKQNVLDVIKIEIRRLKDRHKESASLESQRNKGELLRRHVPESPELDRLLRYEASLERAFDRTLAHLERQQRLRLGQPVAPRIDVNFSA